MAGEDVTFALSRLRFGRIGLRAPLLLLAGLLLQWPLSTAAALPELEVIRFTFGTSSQEISGAALLQGRLHVVADGPQDFGIYTVRPMDNDSNSAPILISAHCAAPASTSPPWRATPMYGQDRLIDLEGICTCGSTIYLGNERASKV